ncbi:MAG: protein kinase, partial [Caldimonas sp.]
MPIGSRLRDYEITGVLAEGDFAIVYLARDHSLQRMVAVKEYLPVAIASRRSQSAAIVVEPGHAEDFEAGLKSFVAEARVLARFDHPSLVKAYRFWEDNGTAYMAMPFYEGPTLKTALAELGHVPGEGELRTWLKPILNAVTVLHEGGTWHQNIGPGEIVLTPTGPVLLGFGAASRAIGTLGHGPVSTLKPGFAALEQYGIDAATAVGPWTDLYALAAVLYDAIAGAPPQSAPERLNGDTLQPLSQVAAGLYSTGFLAAIDAALAIRPAERCRSHDQFRAAMGDIAAPAASASLAPRRDLMQEPFLRDTSSHREVTVPDRPLRQPIEPPPVKATAGVEHEARGQALADDDRAGGQGGRQEAAWMGDGGPASGRGKRTLFGVVAGV